MLENILQIIFWSLFLAGVLGLIIFVQDAYAAKDIPIRVEIVQCGDPEKILEACKKDKRCCVLVENNE